MDLINRITLATIFRRMSMPEYRQQLARQLHVGEDGVARVKTSSILAAAYYNENWAPDAGKQIRNISYLSSNIAREIAENTENCPECVVVGGSGPRLWPIFIAEYAVIAAAIRVLGGGENPTENVPHIAPQEDEAIAQVVKDLGF